MKMSQMQLKPQIFTLSQKREKLKVDWYLASDSCLSTRPPVVWQCVGGVVQSSLALGTCLHSVFLSISQYGNDFE